jgi:hypothetical protein
MFLKFYRYDKGMLHHLSNVTPPWPAFMFAASNEVLEKDAGAVERFLQAVSLSAKGFLEGGPAVKESQSEEDEKHDELSPSVDFIMQKFSYNRTDVERWFQTVGYEADVSTVRREIVEKCVRVLAEAGVVIVAEEEGDSKKQVEASSVNESEKSDSVQVDLDGFVWKF